MREIKEGKTGLGGKTTGGGGGGGLLASFGLCRHLLFIPFRTYVVIQVATLG